MPVQLRGFRRRVAIAFVLACGTAAGVLAVATFFLVRSDRGDDFMDRAEDQTRVSAQIAAQELSELPTPGAFRRLESIYAVGHGYRTVLVSPDLALHTDESITESDVPTALLAGGDGTSVDHARATIAGTSYLVTATDVAGTDARLYLFFSTEPLRQSIARWRTYLIAGWVLVPGLGAGVAVYFARQVLRPVREASRAARALAEGMLETRLAEDTDDEFGSWAAAFNDMADALQHKIDALTASEQRERRFAADVAHELRTPLGALVTAASMLRDHLDRLPEPARDLAASMVGDVTRLRRAVEEIMAVSRFDASHEQIERHPVRLMELLTETFDQRGWTADVHLTGADVSLVSDPARIERVVANLVDNAFRHGAGRPTVHVQREHDAATVTITVTDRGPGIPAEHLPYIFDRFYKGDRSRSTGGSGLGLAIAAENVRLLGGTITAGNDAGGGARFTVSIPLHP